MSVPQWSLNASENANADPDINFSEGQSANTVNNSARAMMAALAAFFRQSGGTILSGGAGNSFTFASPAGFGYAALVDGMRLSFRANRANTGAATLSVDGLPAKQILKEPASLALVTGDIIANRIYDVVYNQALDAFELRTPTRTSSAVLRAFADLNATADRLAFFTGPASFGLAALTSTGRALIAATDVSAVRSFLELGSLALRSTINNTNWAGTALSLGNGGTGSTSASGARASLGIGSMATRNVTISSGSPSGGADGDIWFQF